MWHDLTLPAAVSWTGKAASCQMIDTAHDLTLPAAVSWTGKAASY